MTVNGYLKLFKFQSNFYKKFNEENVNDFKTMHSKWLEFQYYN